MATVGNNKGRMQYETEINNPRNGRGKTRINTMRK